MATLLDEVLAEKDVLPSSCKKKNGSCECETCRHKRKTRSAQNLPGLSYRPTRDNTVLSEIFNQGINFETPPGDRKAQPAIPAVIDHDKNADGFTWYVNIDLGMQKEDRAYKVCIKWNVQKKCIEKEQRFVKDVPAMTAIYAPSHFNPEKPADLIIYLHGHTTAAPGVGGSIKTYLNFQKRNYFKLREAIKASGKNVILVAPTLGPLSQSGKLTRPGEFDSFLSKVFNLLKDKIRQQEIKFGRLILAAHSGGGKPMLAISQLKDKYSKQIKEIWGFDSWYWSKTDWENVVANNPNIKIYGYYNDSRQIPCNTAKICVVPTRLDHFALLPHFFKERLDEQACGSKQSTKKKEMEYLFSELEFEKPAGQTNNESAFKIVSFENKLLSQPIVVAKYRQTKHEKFTIIEEAPAVFLPKIVENALGAAGKDWFKNFTRISFLGRNLKPDQYVHVEFAKKLKDIEKKFADKYGGPNKDPDAAGKLLLGNYKELISGSRSKSSTATFSMHMFGLAVDMNYTRNPFIEEGDISILNSALERAGWLINGAPDKYLKGMSYDQIKRLDTLLENYFGLIDDPVSLAEKLKKGSSLWKGYTLENAKRKISEDLKKVATRLARGNKIDIIKKSGIIDLSRDFVSGMIKEGLDWGGRYGDMMHFDMRNLGVGAKINKARVDYMNQKKKQAREKYYRNKNNVVPA